MEERERLSNGSFVGTIEVKGDLDKKEAIKALEGGTQDDRVDSEQRAPTLKSMMKISNKLKTAAKVFDFFLKENGVKFGIGKFDIWHLKSLQWG